MDFRLYFMVEGVIKGIPNIKPLGGFGRVAISELSQSNTLDVSSATLIIFLTSSL